MKLLPDLLKFQDQVLRGMEPTLHHNKPFVWEQCLNMRCTPTHVEPVNGSFVGTTTGVSIPNHCVGRSGWTKVASDLIGITGNSTTAVVFTRNPATGATTVSTGLTVAGGRAFSDPDPTMWSTIPWGIWLLTTAGVEGNIWKYIHGTGFSTIVSAGAPRILAQLGPHVLGFNYAYTNEPTKFAWCTADDVDDWTTTVTNTAGDLIIREFTTPITAVVPLGDKLAVYSESEMALVSYIGAPFVFGYTMIFRGDCPVFGMNSVVTVGEYNYGWGPKGFFKTDGVSVQFFSESMHDYIKNMVNVTAYSAWGKSVNLVHDITNSEIQVYSKNNTTSTDYTCFVYNYKTEAWYVKTSNRCNAVFVAQTGKVLYINSLTPYLHEDTINYSIATPVGTTALQNLLTSKPFPIDQFVPDEASSENVMKFIQSIMLDIKLLSTRPETDLEIGFMESWDDSPVYWLQRWGYERVWPLRKARYLRLKILVKPSSSSDIWRFQGFSVTGKVVGKRV